MSIIRLRPEVQRMGELVMNRPDRELTLMDALTDPLVQALMEADQVDARELEAALNEVAGTLRRQSGYGGPAVARICRLT
jgi:hypothetical protein